MSVPDNVTQFNPRSNRYPTPGAYEPPSDVAFDQEPWMQPPDPRPRAPSYGAAVAGAIAFLAAAAVVALVALGLA